MKDRLIKREDGAPRRELSELLTTLQKTPDELGVIIVDHGSRREESNQLLLSVAASFRKASGL